MKIINSYKSPHYTLGRKTEIKAIIIHYISAVNILPKDPYNVTECLDLLCKPINYVVSGQEKSIKVSAHYLINRSGVIYHLVDDSDTAWHAGKSALNGYQINKSCNDFSIGIELIGGQWEPFTDSQYDSLVLLTQSLIKKYPLICKDTIVGHEHIAPGRKIDPGKHFDWNMYYRRVFTPKNEHRIMSIKEIINNENNKNIALSEIHSNVIPKENNITDGRDSKEGRVSIKEKILTILHNIRKKFKWKP